MMRRVWHFYRDDYRRRHPGRDMRRDIVEAVWVIGVVWLVVTVSRCMA